MTPKLEEPKVTITLRDTQFLIGGIGIAGAALDWVPSVTAFGLIASALWGLGLTLGFRMLRVVFGS